MVMHPLRPHAERTEAVPPPELTLIEELELVARVAGLSDRALTLACGIDHGLWIRVRRGERRFGPEVCARIVRAYPALRASAARYLADTYGGPALQLLAEASWIAATREEGPVRRACR